MLWFFLAVLAHSFFALGNLVDARLQRHLIKNSITQLFLGSFFGLLVLFCLLLILQPAFPPEHLWGWTLMGGVFGFSYILPYFAALKHDDSSVIISYFSLGKIFVPILSFVILKEHLTLPQYCGFLIVLMGSFLLRFRPSHPPHAKPLLLMILSSLLLALHYISYKLVFEEIGWLNGFLWGMFAGSLVLTSTLLFFPATKKHLKEDLINFKKFAPFLSLSFVFGALGTITMTYAINLSSPTLVAAISPFQPFLVFFIGLILCLFIKNYHPYEIGGHKSTAFKLFAFSLMACGILLVLFGQT